MTGSNGQTEHVEPAEEQLCPRVTELERRVEEAIRLLERYGSVGAPAALKVLRTGER